MSSTLIYECQGTHSIDKPNTSITYSNGNMSNNSNKTTAAITSTAVVATSTTATEGAAVAAAATAINDRAAAKEGAQSHTSRAIPRTGNRLPRTGGDAVLVAVEGPDGDKS